MINLIGSRSAQQLSGADAEGRRKIEFGTWNWMRENYCSVRFSAAHLAPLGGSRSLSGSQNQSVDKICSRTGSAV